MPDRKIGRRLHQAARVATLVALQHSASRAEALGTRLQVLAALERDAGLQAPPGCALFRQIMAQPRLDGPGGAARPVRPHSTLLHPAAPCSAPPPGAAGGNTP